MKILSGWKIEFIPNTSEGYCWRNKKIITIGVDNTNIIRLLLHEIAHIHRCKNGNQHTQKWFNEYIKLHHKFFKKTPISKGDKIIKKVYGLKERNNGKV